ncbi:thiamine pyrophosphate-dependent dehydrogenase E1 component subunit alpha [Spiroplasma endosymbiont of Labia minor]|uniref:thiamine pyrophosphate-dependent dehydrogenase E1 component subunit alpha n=1 Tax=Spiroplasma endosymbiont of Labia minor TaxID=3066305 RepID=UPI0030CB1C11
MKYINQFDSSKNIKLQIMNKNGAVINNDLLPNIEDKTILEAYKIMNLSRIQDDFQTKMQRQGRLLSFLTSTGQEATEVGYSMCLRKDKDWFLSGYRNNAAWLTMGVPMRNIMLFWVGNENGGRSPNDINVLPPNIVIGTQYSQAAGIAFANQYKNIDSVVLTTTGDGGTSEGETYEAMNFAMLHKVPCIFICENNKWAISTPIIEQTASLNFAIKAKATGMPSIKVDGNDFLAVYGVIKEAHQFVKENGPIFIEFDTYRLGPHSSSDSPDVYREKEQFDEAQLSDPLIRLKKYLMNKNLWDENQQNDLNIQQLKFIENEFDWVEKNKNYPLKDIFNYQYAEMDLFLKEQYHFAEYFFNNYPLNKEGE